MCSEIENTARFRGCCIIYFEECASQCYTCPYECIVGTDRHGEYENK